MASSDDGTTETASVSGSSNSNSDGNVTVSKSSWWGWDNLVKVAKEKVNILGLYCIRVLLRFVQKGHVLCSG